MKHFLLDGIENPDEIKRILADNAEGMEEKTYLKQLTEEEVADLREKYVDNNIAMEALNEDLKEAKEIHKEAMKPYLEENSGALQAIRTKHREITEKVFRFPNFESGMMDYINAKGDVVESRRLKPDEKQGRVFPIASNDQ